MDDYLIGEKLYGDDFDQKKINDWFEKEKEGYAGLVNNDVIYRDFYGYHNLNKIYGFNKIKNKTFGKVLGIGSAFGSEFEPIISRIKDLNIIEPSSQLRSKLIGKITPKYYSPNNYGKIEFESNYFDLITCLGVLHHIPNVTFVLSELIRVLKPGGYILIREPITSMGDWNMPRSGLTANERGIPKNIFEAILKKNNAKIISKNYCLTNTPIFTRIFSLISKKPIYSFKLYIWADRIISQLLLFNYSYHPQVWWKKIMPSNVFYVISK
jgi:SAM-dependent methyltransferase